MRTGDLINLLPILRVAYINTFGGLAKIYDHLFTVDDGELTKD